MQLTDYLHLQWGEDIIILYSSSCSPCFPDFWRGKGLEEIRVDTLPKWCCVVLGLDASDGRLPCGYL